MDTVNTLFTKRTHVIVETSRDVSQESLLDLTDASCVPSETGSEEQASKMPESGDDKSSKVTESGDKTDAGGFGVFVGGHNVAKMSVSRDSEYYNMSHPQRGKAIIFNHKYFDQRLQLKPRNGTDVDRENLRQRLKDLDFQVEVFNDLRFCDIEKLLKAASDADHSNEDCLFVAVLTHGEQNILYASDQPYKPERLWDMFTADICASLAGKPKIFFIQACQGDKLDSGVTLVKTTETDSGSLTYKIPSHADFLIAYSTIPGFFSWRNTSNGSWFVQAFCEVLKMYGRKRDLLSMLTIVCRKVALEFESNTPGDVLMHQKKQVPCITSRLTREIIFLEK